MSISEKPNDVLADDIAMASTAERTGPTKKRRRTRWGRALTLWPAAVWLTLIVSAAALAPFLPLPEARYPSAALYEPILASPSLSWPHLLGTDRQGLDLLAGAIHGARTSLVVGLGATLIGLTVGGSLGIIAGYTRGATDRLLNLVNDALLAFPPLILLLALAAVITPSIPNITVVLGVLAVPAFFRLTRANALVVSQRNFVLAAESLGARNFRILTRELLPNVVMSALSYAFIVIAVIIVAEASLSFLGLSIQRPEPTWGNMIAAGQDDFQRYPHLVYVPGIFLFLTVLSLNQVGDWARGRWDPRARKL